MVIRTFVTLLALAVTASAGLAADFGDPNGPTAVEVPVEAEEEGPDWYRPGQTTWDGEPIQVPPTHPQQQRPGRQPDRCAVNLFDNANAFAGCNLKGR